MRCEVLTFVDALPHADYASLMGHNILDINCTRTQAAAVRAQAPGVGCLRPVSARGASALLAHVFLVFLIFFTLGR